jgi:hypothetical protein
MTLGTDVATHSRANTAFLTIPWFRHEQVPPGGSSKAMISSG